MNSAEKRRWIFDKINIAALIQRNISLYHTTAESKNINLLFQPAENIFAYADYNAIDTVVRNLMSNAVKFSHPNSDIVISTKHSDKKIFISIKDSGIGIPFDIQTRLFALNENIVQQGTHHEKGSGLGLTLCKELLTENNGDITMVSVPEKGSEFIISIPEFRNELNQPTR
jgi:signal transduction histidine kinase